MKPNKYVRDSLYASWEGKMSIKLEVKEATKFYTTKSGNLHALDQFSVGIDSGDFVSIVGPSGCGK